MKNKLALLATVGFLAAGQLCAGIEHPDVKSAQRRQSELERRRAARRAAHEREQRAFLKRQNEAAGEPERSVEPEDQSDRTQLESEREARGSKARNERRARLAREKAAERADAALEATLSELEGASAQAALGFEEGVRPKRSLVSKHWRERTEKYQESKWKNASDADKAKAREIWLKLKEAKDELHEDKG